MRALPRAAYAIRREPATRFGCAASSARRHRRCRRRRRLVQAAAVAAAAAIASADATRGWKPGCWAAFPTRRAAARACPVAHGKRPALQDQVPKARGAVLLGRKPAASKPGVLPAQREDCVQAAAVVAARSAAAAAPPPGYPRACSRRRRRRRQAALPRPAAKPSPPPFRAASPPPSPSLPPYSDADRRCGSHAACMAEGWDASYHCCPMDDAGRLLHIAAATVAQPAAADAAAAVAAAGHRKGQPALPGQGLTFGNCCPMAGGGTLPATLCKSRPPPPHPPIRPAAAAPAARRPRPPPSPPSPPPKPRPPPSRRRRPRRRGPARCRPPAVRGAGRRQQPRLPVHERLLPEPGWRRHPRVPRAAGLATRKPRATATCTWNELLLRRRNLHSGGAGHVLDGASGLTCGAKSTTWRTPWATHSVPRGGDRPPVQRVA